MPFSTSAVLAQPNSTDEESTCARECLTLEERQEREVWKAKLRQRVSFQQIARNLRAKLQYAAYKVQHNVTHLTLEELEARQEAAAAPIPSSSTERRAFVAAATFNAANGHPSDLQRRSSVASPTILPARTRPANIGWPPQSANEGANATQSLYASILAHPPPRRARTMQTTNMQASSSLVRRGTSHSHKSHRDDGDSERACGNNSSHATAISSSSKRKTPASAPRNKASKRKHGDDAAVASRDDDEDRRAAATLTNLFRNSRSGTNARAVQTHVLDHTGKGPSRLSLGYQLQPRRARTQRATTIPAPGSPIKPPRVDASPMQRKIAAGPSAAASTISSTQYLTATGSTLTTVTDNEAVQLLYYLHGRPLSARPQAGVTAHEGDALNDDAVGSRALASEKIAPIFDDQANDRAAFLSDAAGSSRVAYRSAPASSDPARRGSTDTDKPDTNVHYIPPQLRKVSQERTAIVDLPSPVRDAEMSRPIIYVTPPV